MFDGIFGALKVLWVTFVALWQIPDFRQSAYLSLITVAVGFLMRKTGCSSREIGKVCALIELLAIFSALFVI